MPTPIPDRAALQPERTVLSWQRTSITAAASLVALVAIAVRLEDWVLVGVFSVGAMAGVVLVLGARGRFAQLRADDVTTAPYAAMVRVGAATCLAALGGLIAATRLYFG